MNPALGSGALREALTQRITDYLTGGGVFNAEMALHDRVRDLLIDCRAALSLSSPIEPPATCGIIGYPEQGRRVCELPAGHDDYHMQGGVRWLGYHAAPTPQASSEIRERLITIQLEHETKYENRPSGAWLWNCSCGASDQPDSWEGCHKLTREHWADVVLTALAPSRQGAGEK